MENNQLVEILQSLIKEANSEESEFTFPRNVDSTYKVAAGMSLKELFKYLSPAFALTILVLLIPPYSNVAMIIVKIFLIIIFFCISMIFAFIKPIPSRQNISLRKFFANYIDFEKRQKIFYRRKREGKFLKDE